jgi:putative endonuclease
MYYIYIIRSKTSNWFYTGITNNLNRRLREHNKGKRSTPSTRNRGPYKLIYFEQCLSRKEAREREVFWKSGRGRELRDILTKKI